MDKLKIGYYVKYSDPKDGEIRHGLVLNFDDDMVILWKHEYKCPYPIPRMNVKEEKTPSDQFKCIEDIE